MFMLDQPVTPCVGTDAALLTAPTPALAETEEAAEKTADSAEETAAEVGAAADALPSAV